MRIALVASVIITLLISPLCYASGLTDFGTAVIKKKDKVGRPQLVVETATTIVVIFALETCMEEFRYNKITDSYKVREIRKFEDSTKSVWHKDPSQRLEEAIEAHGTTD